MGDVFALWELIGPVKEKEGEGREGGRRNERSSTGFRNRGEVGSLIGLTNREGENGKRDREREGKKIDRPEFSGEKK